MSVAREREKPAGSLRADSLLPSYITSSSLICFRVGATDLTTVKWMGPAKRKLDHSNVTR
jgi:hypothetical protein